MSLWYKTGQNWQTISFAKETTTQNAFLCCGGPSLSLINPKFLNGPNRTIFGVNNVYPFIRPDVWVGMDHPKCFNREMFWEPFIKILRDGFYNSKIEGGIDINMLPNTYYADIGETKDKEDIFKYRGHDTRFLWNWNSFAFALHTIIWMGYGNIYIIGCDFDTSQKDYFNGVKLSDYERKYNQHLYGQLYEYLKWFSETSPKYDIHVYSCSENSKINNYLEYKYYLDVIKELEEPLPRGFSLYHTSMIKKITNL